MSPEVAEIFDGYPNEMRRKLMFLRDLVYQTAAETEGVGKVTESIKWGEPSYLAKGGSGVRIDWKKSRSNEYAMYFHCATKLVNVFRKLYGEKFAFEGNRAIIFRTGDDIPIDELKRCISLALTYHRRKKQPMLGA